MKLLCLDLVVGFTEELEQRTAVVGVGGRRHCPEVLGGEHGAYV